jgi:hypothetical protein
MNNLYVAVDTGCIECGEETNVLGVFTCKARAEQVRTEHEERHAKNWHGQHSFEVFQIEGIDIENRVEY